MPPKWQGNIKMQVQGPCVQAIFDIAIICNLIDVPWCSIVSFFLFLANVFTCKRFKWVYCNNDTLAYENDWQCIKLLNVTRENIKMYIIDSKASVKLKTILGV